MRNRSAYPKNWDEISLKIRNEVNWICEGCGRTCRKTGESVADFISRVGFAPEQYDEIRKHPIKYTLTVAHLNHTPADCSRENLKALCTRCHLIYDGREHARSRVANRMRHLESLGQGSLF